MTWGILRPTILLPSPLWHAWTTEQRQIVLLHELAHIKRLDVLYQAFSRLVCSLYWFHPLVWHGHRQMRLSREQACDDYVLTHGVSSSVYAQHLLNVARQSRTPPTLIAVAMAQQSGLERRIRAILNSSRSRLPLSKRASQATLLAFIFGAALIAVPKISTGTMPQDKAASEKATPSKSQASDDGATKAEKPDTPNQPDDQPLVAAPNELVGVVVDSDGKPVAGASVDAWSWYPGNETETDANGQFRLKLDDPRAKIELRISKEGYSPVYIPQQPIGFAHFKATLGQKTYIEGTVRDANGSPVANTEVRGEFGPVEADGVMIGFVATKTKTDTQGHYRLFVNPQTYQLQVRTDSGQVARLTGITVQADEGKLQDIALEQGVRFEATVIDSISKEPFPDFVLHHFMHPGIVGRSDSQGKLIIEGMLPGQFEFNIGEGDTQQLGPFKTYMPRTIGRWWSPQAMQPWQREEIKAGEFQRNLDDLTFDLKQGMEPITIYVEKAVTITGRVTDPNGKPVEGATVAPAKSGSGNSLTGDTRFSVKTDADGRYEAIMPAGKDFQYNLVVHDGEYQQWRNWANGVTDPFATQPGERLENVNLQLTQPATVRGRVIANGNQKVGDREIRAHAKDLRENRYYDPTTRTKDDGTFELKFIRPGEHLIQVAPFWLAAGNAPNGSSAAVSLEPGQVVDGIELTIVEEVQQAT